MIPLGVLASGHVAPAGGGGGVSLTYSGGQSSSSKPTYTFTEVPLGDAATDRVVIVGISTRDGDVGSVTVGGVSATIAGQVSANSDRACMAVAAVPTGITGDVVVTHVSPYASQRVLIGVWVASGFGTLTVADHGGSAVNDADISLDTSVGDLIFAVSGALTLKAAENTCAWTGADEDYETDAVGTMESSGAHTVATGTTTTLSAYWSAPRFGSTISPCYAIALA